MPDNRELAALLWLGIAAIGVLSQRNLRAAFRDIFRVFFQPLIVVPLALMLAWIGFELWIGARLSVWHASLIKSTALWTVGSAAVLYFNCTKAASEPGFFRRTLLGTVGVSVGLEFFMNLQVMSFPAEIVLQFAVGVLAMLVAVAGLKPEHKAVKTLCEVLLSAIGIGLFVYTVRQTYLEWGQIDARNLLLEFALPIWLTAALLPFIYLLSLYVVYDAAFRGIGWATTDGSARWRSRLALLSVLHVRTNEVQKFAPVRAKRLTQAVSFASARRVVQEFREELRNARQARLEEQERMRRYAGSQDEDENGQRLDRREFSATIDALRWLETCQMGWYANGGRYRDDILSIQGDDLTRRGLPREHGITVHVSGTGQAWYASRRTVTGWCFAIGASGPPPSQWEYDGREPPQGYPGKDPSWGVLPFDGLANRNWR